MTPPNAIATFKPTVLESVTISAVELRRQAELMSIRVSSELTEPRFAVNLSPRMHRLGWTVVLFFYVFNGLYAMAFAYVHYYMTQAKMGYYSRMLGMMPPDKYDWIIAVYACISAANWYGAFSMIAYSICYRQVAFGKRTLRGLAVNSTKANATGSIFSILVNFWRPLSVRGRWFDHMLMFRELIEIGSQIYQAHSSSDLVSRVWMNQTFAVLIFLNCVTSTTVHWLNRDHTGLRRLICTAIDLVLDFAWSFILPVNIIFNYLPTFIRNSYTFPSTFYYSDTLYIKAMLECSQFFIVSRTDAITTILPYLNMLSGLKNMKLLLLCDRAFGPRRLSLVKVIGSAAMSVAPSLEPSAPVAVKSGSGRSLHILHALVISMGVIALTISIAASGVFTDQSCPSGCKLQMHPWFSRKCGCSVLEINCHTNDIQGTAEEISLVLGTMDERVLHYLIIADCPALIMPNRIRAFHELVGLLIYNSTLEAWPKEASLSFPYMPRMGYVYIARSRLDHGIPAGLTNQLTSNVYDIEIVASQISSIPPDLAQKWPFVMIFYMEFCGLQEFPEPMAFMESAIDVSLVGNNISQLPANISSDHHWLYLSLDGNPIKQLPDQLGTAQLITIQDTHVDSLSASLWGKVRSGVTSVFAFNSTLCEQVISLADAELLGCLKPNYVRDGVFPLAFIDSQRRN